LGALKDIFPHANTVVCIEDSRLLGQVDYDILHNTASLQAALNELNERNYFRAHLDATTDNYSTLLDGLMKSTFDLMKSITPNELVWRIFSLYYDVHNMKLVVKERYFNKRLDNLALGYGSYSLPTIRSAAVRESDNILGNETLTAGFFEALRARGMYEIDFILDKAYFRTLRKLAEELGIPEIIEFVIERIDLFNISLFFQSWAAWRPKGYFLKAFSGQGTHPLGEWMQYVDGEPREIENFPLWKKYQPIWEAARSRRQLFEELDVIIDNYLIGKTKACKLMAFGIEPICAYFYNKFMEIKNIRILLTGKAFNYSAYEIRRRMRIPYEL